MSSSRYRRRITGTLAGFMAASLALAACGSSGSTDTSTTSEAPAASSADTDASQAPADTSEEPATGTTSAAGSSSGSAAEEQGVDDGTALTLWTRAPMEKQANALVEAYNASHQNQVALTIVPNDDYVAKVGAAAGGDQLPDLFAADIVYVPNWTSQGLFADITDKIDGLPYASDLNAGHITAGTYEDKKYVLPFVLDLSVMMWNKALYTEAGLDPEVGPTTVAEYVEHSKKIAALGKDGVTGTAFGGNCGGCLVFTWFPMVWASGAQVMNAEGTESLLAGAEAQEIYAAYKDLVNTPNGVAAGSKEETGATWVAGFQEGKVGVMPYPATLMATADEALGAEVGVGPLPGVSGGGSTFVGGDGIGISKDSKVTDQAWNFLSWMTSDAAQIGVLAAGGDVPSRSDLAKNEYSEKDPRLVTINEVAGDGSTPMAVQFQSAFNAPDSPWLTLVRNAVFGDATSIEADNEEITAVLGE